jgi:CheY-like chemotaxis protein
MKRALVAEDNPVNRELLRELLELRGYEVSEAADGEAALAALQDQIPDVLLLDIGMPVLDGYATVRRIREDARYATLPVVAVTAYAMRGDREKMLAAGFNAYLSKPIDHQTLHATLESLLLAKQ